MVDSPVDTAMQTSLLGQAGGHQRYSKITKRLSGFDAGISIYSNAQFSCMPSYFSVISQAYLLL